MSDAAGAAGQQSTRLLRSSAIVGLGTALSRITGFVRVAAIAYAIGAGALAGTYSYANETPNMLYELQLGGVLTATLVPQFVRHVEREDDEAVSAIMTVSIAVLVFSEFGYRRLDVANRQSTTALEMEARLNDVMQLVVDAETAQRGYLLTGDPTYLEPYKNALQKLDPSLALLRESVSQDGSMQVRDRLTKLTGLIGKRFNEIESTLVLNEKSGREAAFQLIDTGIGKRTMDEIRSEAAAMSNDLRAKLSTGTTRWQQDIEFARIGMVTMTAFTVALLLVVWVLARREISLREEQRRRSLQEQSRLESLVSARTAELSGRGVPSRWQRSISARICASIFSKG